MIINIGLALGCYVRDFQIKEYITGAGSCPFRDWLETLAKSIKARIQARVFRFEAGNFGDCKPVGSGVYEARLDFGPGYRVYFGIATRRLVILLIGGEKKRQNRDISKAKEYWTTWKGENP